MTDFRVFVEKPIGKILTLFDVFSATLWGGGVTLKYGKNDWKKWNFDLSTMVKMNEKIQKKIHFSPYIMSIWKKVLIISVVSWNYIFLKTKIQNRIYRDFEHHFLTNFGKIIFFKIPYIWEFYGFFRKKQQKNTNIQSSYTLYFQHFFEKKIEKWFFFPIVLVLVHIGISTPFKHKKRRKNFLESLKSVTCSRFHQDMFAANDNMSNELLKNDT